MIKYSDKYIKHIEQSLLKTAPKRKSADLNRLASYIGTGYRVLGFDTPQLRQITKKGWGISHSEEWPLIADAVYKGSKIFEAKNAALYLFDYNAKKIEETQKFDLLPDWIHYTDNWAHSDFLSKFYTQFLESEKLKKPFLKILEKWNTDADGWKRRQSLVSLYYYARTKKSFLPYAKSERMINNLLEDKEYYVQKGLGWALRESFNVYPAETYKFIFKNAQIISSTAFSAACEKMSIKQKEVLKNKRKKFKNKPKIAS